jgi:hypothetical protein
MLALTNLRKTAESEALSSAKDLETAVETQEEKVDETE